MIDRTAFTREMALLHDRFGRPVSQPVVARYFDTLNAALDTDAFLRAARVIFDGDKFWPAPARFVEAAHGSVSEHAEREWQRLLDASTRGQPLDPATLPAAVATGYAAAGGYRGIAFAEGLYALADRKRAFVRAFSDAIGPTGAAALPAPADDHPALEDATA